MSESAPVGAPPVPSAVSNSSPQNDPGNSPANGTVESTSQVPNSSEVTSEQKPKDDPRLASKFAQLSRREKQIREAKQQLAAEQQQLQKYRDAERLAKEDPLKLIESLGLPYQQLTEHYMDMLDKQHNAKDPDRRLSTVEQRIKDYDEQVARQAEEQKKASLQAEVNAFKSKVIDAVNSQPDKFELVIARGAQEDVFDLIEAHFNKTQRKTGNGEVMTVERAAQLVEDHLWEEAQAYLKANKVKAKFAVVKGDQESPDEQRADAHSESERSKEGEHAVPRSATLTNSNTAASAAGMPKAALSVEESLRRATAMLKFKE